MYINKLKRNIEHKDSHLVVGLDTDFKKIPFTYKSKRDPIFEFNRDIINATSDLVVGYKINTAFYESMGSSGFRSLEKTVRFIPKNSLKICDAKRCDIENTSEHYAIAYFDNLQFDAITISPYMGLDAAKPFLKRKNKFVYLLGLTTNPSAKDIQHINVKNKKLFEIIINLGISLGKKRIGFVIGANHTDVIRDITGFHKDLAVLIPGIGFQGNDISKLTRSLNNNLYLINVSRSVIYAGSENDRKDVYLKKVRDKVLEIDKTLKIL